MLLKECFTQWYSRYVLEDEVLRQDWFLLVAALLEAALILWAMVQLPY